jgi:hypothetical protein
LAIGKAIDFRETEFFDPESSQTFRGIFTTVYVSKGSESTWEKVLDGTLTGFSIGGKILEKADEVNKSSGQTQRVIKDYELVELSLVDSPCNQLANIMSIQKNDGGYLIKGLVAEITTQNVFRCEDDNIVMLTEKEGADCAECDKQMTNIGWVEDTEGKEEQVKALVAKSMFPVTTTNSSGTNSTYKIKFSNGGGMVLSSNGDMTFSNTNAAGTLVQKDSTGGVEMAKQENTPSVEETEAPKTEPVTETEKPKGEAVEKAAEVSEIEPAVPAAPDLDELLEKFSARVESVVGTVREESTAAIEKAETTFTEAVGAVDTKITGLVEKFDSLDSRVKSIEDRSAIKKSAELVGEMKTNEVTNENNFWRGSFISAHDLTN